MALAAPVVDGKVVQTTGTSANKSAEKTKSSNSMDKDSFLQLLVAQMKYQDPMEPQSNTEYVAQYAQFSELEAMQNLSANMDMQRASGLVGKDVMMKTYDASGNMSLITGRVDYITTEGSKVFLSINGKSYNLDDLDSVVDSDYLNAVTLASEFEESLSKLPSVPLLTLNYKDVIDNLSKVYNDMSDYQKSYLSKDLVSKFSEYVEKMKELVGQEEASKKTE